MFLLFGCGYTEVKPNGNNSGGAAKVITQDQYNSMDHAERMKFFKAGGSMEKQ